MHLWAKYGTQTDIRFAMVKRGVVDLAATGDWTPATGDTKVSKDGGSYANSTNNPAAVGGTGSIGWKVTLSATELQCAELNLQIVDSATKAVEDQFLTVYTYGNASAKVQADLSDVVRLGLTALPNAAAEAAGGLYTRGSGAGQVNQNANGQVDSRTVAMATDVVTATAIAADAIGASEVAADAIGASELATDAIGAAEIAAAAIGAAELADASIDAAAFAAGAIDASAIATDAIGAAELAASAIGASELATDAIGAAEIADDAIDAGALAANSITSSEIADDSIDAGAIAASAIGASELATDAIGSAELADDSIDAGAIAASAIGASELAADAITSSELATSAADEIADEVWDEALSGHLSAGSTGEALDAAASGTLAGAGALTRTIRLRVSGVPVQGAQIWVATDTGASNVVAGPLVTDSFGVVTVYVDAGTYYVWARKDGYVAVAAQAWVVS